MFTVSIQKEFPSRSGGYFYTGKVQVDNGLSFFPRVNQYEDGNIKISMPAHVSILSEQIADQLTEAFHSAVKKFHENPGSDTREEISIGDEKIMSSVDAHLTTTKDGSTPTVYESSRFNSYANITFDFSDRTGEKMFGIDTTLRERSDGSGKFIALPSKLGSDGKYYKEVTCSREVSDLLNQKGLALYDAELSKKPSSKDKEKEPAQKSAKKSALTR